MGGMDWSALRRAVNHTLTMLATILFAAFSWYFYRLPNDNSMSLIGAMQIAGACYDVRRFRDRFALSALTLASGGFFQFLISVTYQCKFLQLIAGGILTWLILAFFPNRQCACISVLLGHLALTAPGGWMPGFDRIATIGFSFGAVLFGSLLVPVVHQPKHETIPWPGTFSHVEAIRVALAAVIGVWLMQAFRIPQGSWIYLTMIFTYMSWSPGNPMTRLVHGRVFGTPAGLYAGFLFMSCFTWFDFRLIYLLPFLVAFGFFLLYYTGNYFVYTIFFMMSFCLYADFSSGAQGNPHILQLILSRTASSMLGVLVLLLFHNFFLPARKQQPEKAAA